jgi:putative ABC transport system permease protein
MLMVWANFASGKMRATFMLLSTAIGVFSLTAVLVVSQAGKNMVFEEIQSVGINRIWAFRDLNELYQEPNPNPWTSNKMLSGEIVENIAETCRSIRLLAPSFRRPVEVTYRGKIFSGLLLIGAGCKWGIIHNEQIERGRFLAPLDEQRRNPVCVLSQKAAKLIFGDSPPMDETLQIGIEHFKVIGILRKNERPLLESIQAVPLREETIIVPYTVLQAPQWLNTLNAEYLDFQAAGFESVEQTGEDIKKYLALTHGGRHRFEVRMLHGEIKRAKSIMQILTVTLGILGGIAMLIAGFGIANFMLASVTERCHEIGVRRAVGATRKDILLQFVLEATIVGVGGGVIGMVMALWCAYLGSFWLEAARYSFWPAASAALVVSGLTGMLAGVYPARKAANLNPIDALAKV